MNLMKVVAAVFLLVLIAKGDLVLALRGLDGLIPKAGFVPDASTAEAIAEAVLLPVYGKEVVVSERPFKATLRAELWFVKGLVPCWNAPPGASCPGGSAEIRISKSLGPSFI